MILPPYNNGLTVFLCFQWSHWNNHKHCSGFFGDGLGWWNVGPINITWIHCRGSRCSCNSTTALLSTTQNDGRWSRSILQGLGNEEVQISIPLTGTANHLNCIFIYFCLIISNGPAMTLQRHHKRHHDGIMTTSQVPMMPSKMMSS